MNDLSQHRYPDSLKNICLQFVAVSRSVDIFYFRAISYAEEREVCHSCLHIYELDELQLDLDTNTDWERFGLVFDKIPFTYNAASVDVWALNLTMYKFQPCVW